MRSNLSPAASNCPDLTSEAFIASSGPDKVVLTGIMRFLISYSVAAVFCADPGLFLPICLPLLFYLRILALFFNAYCRFLAA